jgi:hypothetical protein
MSSILENIMADIKSTLQGIAPNGTPASGYSTPIKRVWRWGPDAQVVYPYIVIGDTSEKYTQLNMRTHEKVLTVEIEGYAKIEFTDDDEVGAYANAFIADMERALMQDVGRGTSNNCPNARDTSLEANEKMVYRGSDPILMVTMTIRVVYQQRIGDPSLQIP